MIRAERLASIMKLASQIKERELQKLKADEEYEIMNLVDANTIIRLAKEGVSIKDLKQLTTNSDEYTLQKTV